MPDHLERNNDHGSFSAEVDGVTPAHVVKRSALNSFAIIATCTCAMIAISINTTSVSFALPRIGQDLSIPQDQLQWLVSAYNLTSGCLLLLLGRLADLYGRKKAFLLGTCSIAAFSLGCGFAKDAITLDILRALQGIGAAATIPASLGILAQSFPPSHLRSVAFATFGAGQPLGTIAGMSLGGVLIEKTSPSWRSTFYFASAITFVVALSGVLFIDPDVPRQKSAIEEEDRRVDWIGAMLITIGLVLIVFVLSDGSTASHGWRTPYIIALLIVGIAFVGLFLLWQGYLERIHAAPNARIGRFMWTPPPILPLSIWTRAKGRLAAVVCIALLTFMSFLSWNFWIQLYYQDYLQLSPIKSMVRLLPMVFTGISCNIIVAFVIGRVSLVWFMAIGTSVTSLAPLLLALVKPSASYWTYDFFGAIASVCGADFVFSSGTLFVAKIVAEHEQSVAGGLFQTMAQLGTSLGLALTTIAFNAAVGKHHQTNSDGGGVSSVVNGDAVPHLDALLQGYKAASWAAFAFGVLATALAIISMRGVGIIGHRTDLPKGGGDDTIAADDTSVSSVREKISHEQEQQREGKIDV